MRENAEMIANLDPFGPPLIADMDTGYGGTSVLSPPQTSYFTPRSDPVYGPATGHWPLFPQSNTVLGHRAYPPAFPLTILI